MLFNNNVLNSHKRNYLRKINKSIQVEKEVKPYLFSDDMILYRENSAQFTKATTNANN